MVEWFKNHKYNFENYVLPLKDKKIDILQIGVYEGDASAWIIENVLVHPESTLTDVDVWDLYEVENYRGHNFLEAEKKYDKQCKSDKVFKNKMSSNDFFKNNKKEFDFIYIDGNHMASQVLIDLCNAIIFSKVDTIIGIDDYLWNDAVGGETSMPKIAIDSFLSCFKDHIEVIHMGYQVWVKVISKI